MNPNRSPKVVMWIDLIRFARFSRAWINRQPNAVNRSAGSPSARKATGRTAGQKMMIGFPERVPMIVAPRMGAMIVQRTIAGIYTFIYGERCESPDSGRRAWRGFHWYGGLGLFGILSC